jgi:hypothetical protein
MVLRSSEDTIAFHIDACDEDNIEKLMVWLLHLLRSEYVGPGLFEPMSSISTPGCRGRGYDDHHRPRSEPASITAKRRSICTANTSGASAPLPNATTATESIPPGVVAR